MTFEEWAREYFGANVDVPEACLDAWNAATNEEREACAKLCEAASDAYAVQWDENGDREAHAASQAAQSCADSIRMRSNASN